MYIDRINADILTGKNLSSIADMEFIYLVVRLFSSRGGDGIKGVPLFYLAARITLLEYMRICCNRQINIHQLIFCPKIPKTFRNYFIP